MQPSSGSAGTWHRGIASLFLGALFREVCGSLLFEADAGFTGEGLLAPPCTELYTAASGASRPFENGYASYRPRQQVGIMPGRSRLKKTYARGTSEPGCYNFTTSATPLVSAAGICQLQKTDDAPLEGSIDEF